MTTIITGPTRSIVLATAGVPGPQGIQGPMFAPPSVVNVFTQADLPAPSAGVITLVAGTAYIVYGFVSLTAGVRIEAPADVILLGNSPSVSQIIGNVDAPLMTIIAPTVASGTGHVEYVQIQNTSSGSSAKATRLNAAAGVVTIDSCRLIGANGALHVDAIASAKILGSNHIATVAGADTVRITSASAIVFEYCQWSGSGASSKLISIPAGATVGDLLFTRSGFVFGAASQSGLNVNATATVGSVIVSRVLAFGAAGSFNVGWDQSTVRYTVADCPALPNSVAGGTSFLSTTPSTITIGAINTWQDISTGASIFTLEANAERFALQSALNGEVRYTGIPTRKFTIIGSASMRLTSGSTRQIGLSIWKNGVLIAATQAVADIQSGRYGSFATIATTQSLVTGDMIKIRVNNTESTTSIEFQSVGLTVIGLGL